MDIMPGHSNFSRQSFGPQKPSLTKTHKPFPDRQQQIRENNKVDIEKEGLDISDNLIREKQKNLAYQLLRAIERIARKGLKTEESITASAIKEHRKSDLFMHSVEIDLTIESYAASFYKSSHTSSTSVQTFSVFELNFSLSYELDFVKLTNKDVEVTAFNEVFTIDLEISVVNTTLMSEEEQMVDPLILSINNSESVFKSDHDIVFDLDGDGIADKFDALANGNYFLALDLNENGVIDSGKELFGDQNGASDGFHELSKYDADGNMKIDQNDPVYERLTLTSLEATEAISLQKLSSFGITELLLNSIEESQSYYGKNLLQSTSSYNTVDGDRGIIGDFLIRATKIL
ncbi:hypothetical protein [Aliikangiella sp. G2MR2-5]|uniref:hypothetical protein n=1 Tax=Aliikangiella sp. G2MR2-5 TaxID=2788943 RepID=UPI0018AC078E|nr:hypothetical protein [Aliikangiella sp. G2MR2-5]